MNYLQNERVLILGLGISGLAMARWCARCGAFVRVADTRESPAGLESLKREVENFEFVGGEFTAALLHDGITRVLRSPGLMPQNKGLREVLAAAQNAGISVQAEVELFTEALQQIDSQRTKQEEALHLEAMQQHEQEHEDTTVFSDDREQDIASEEEVDPNADYKSALLDEEVLVTSESFLPVLGYKPKVLAVTGTNGKTTVTSLTAQLVKRSGRAVVAAGNIGLAMMDALSQCLDAAQLPDVWVLELSSFQLDGAHSFEPSAATILNLSQDHLDWHGSQENYALAKGHIFGPRTIRVLNRDDQEVMKFTPESIEKEGTKRKRTKEMFVPMVTFGTDQPHQAGDFGLVERAGVTWLAQALASDEAERTTEVSMNLLMPVDVLHIRGRHNASNALAALALGTEAGCEIGPVLQALRDYRGEPHRVEFVANIGGVDYLDDSKGTNVGATASAIAGIGSDHAIALILGGQGKGQDFAPLAPLVSQYVKVVALIGEDAPLIKKALEKTGAPLMNASTMSDAVRICAEYAQAGDVVLLSPACASLDMYKDYSYRAQAFIDAVEQLSGVQGQELVIAKGGEK